jgi:quercetin dioxygenase-like cupin family protein
MRRHNIVEMASHRRQQEVLMRLRILAMCQLATIVFFASACDSQPAVDPAAYENYEIVSAGTRRFEWDSDNGPGSIKVLIEDANLGSAGAEIAEIWFPPGWQGSPHAHELEIIYVIEGELDHIVNGESHLLRPGMTGVVRARDRVVHKTNAGDGARVLVVWPLGGEVEGFAASGMQESTMRQ